MNNDIAHSGYNPEIEDFVNNVNVNEEDDSEGDAGDESSSRNASSHGDAGDAKNKKVIEFAIIMLLIVAKVSLYFILRYCQEQGFDTNIYETI